MVNDEISQFSLASLRITVISAKNPNPSSWKRRASREKSTPVDLSWQFVSTAVERAERDTKWWIYSTGSSSLRGFAGWFAAVMNISIGAFDLAARFGDVPVPLNPSYGLFARPRLPLFRRDNNEGWKITENASATGLLRTESQNPIKCSRRIE